MTTKRDRGSETELEGDLQVESLAKSLPAGGSIQVSVTLEVEGRGSFNIGVVNTASGNLNPPFKPGTTQNLVAKPAKGFDFDIWEFNGVFSSDEPKHRVFIRRGLNVKAIFKEKIKPEKPD